MAGYNHVLNMSNNAVAAYMDGAKPLSKWTKTGILQAIDAYGHFEKPISINKFKKLTRDQLIAFLKFDSWHHTGVNYKKTSFYTLNAEVLELYSDGAFDFNDTIKFRFDDSDVKIELCDLLETSPDEFTARDIPLNAVRNKFAIYLEGFSYLIVNWKEIKRWKEAKGLKNWKEWIADCKYDFSVEELKTIKQAKADAL